MVAVQKERKRPTKQVVGAGQARLLYCCLCHDVCDLDREKIHRSTKCSQKKIAEEQRKTDQQITPLHCIFLLFSYLDPALLTCGSNHTLMTLLYWKHTLYPFFFCVRAISTHSATWLQSSCNSGRSPTRSAGLLRPMLCGLAQCVGLCPPPKKGPQPIELRVQVW